APTDVGFAAVFTWLGMPAAIGFTLSLVKTLRSLTAAGIAIGLLSGSDRSSARWSPLDAGAAALDSSGWISAMRAVAASTAARLQKVQALARPVLAKMIRRRHVLLTQAMRECGTIDLVRLDVLSFGARAMILAVAAVAILSAGGRPA